MYLERRSGATLADSALHLFQLGVAFDEFFCAPPRETDGKAAVLIIAFDADNRAYAEIRVANLLAQKRVRVGSAS